MGDELRVFVGFDPREAAAYHVCCQSIIENTKAHVSFHPIRGDMRDGSNAFTYARFLVPYLCGFNGTALFLDGDMLVRGDIADLFALARLDRGCQVVKHDYKTKHPVKYLGNKNEDYPRKNWSSVILWNCGYFPNRALIPDFVNGRDGSYLHRFGWLLDDQIGELPAEWNHLTMEYAPSPAARLLHTTIGIPPFYPEQEGADEWFATRQRAMEPYGA